MTEQKGFDLLICAWLKIDKKIRKNWVLRIVGPAGSAKPKLEKLIKINQLEYEIELASESNNIKHEYQKASIYVLSSRYEGFGLTLLEAMGQKLPVIAFDCPMGPREIIGTKYGQLLPPNDLEKLSLSIKFFMLNKALRKQYGELAFERSKKYSTENIIHLWQLMIHQI